MLTIWQAINMVSNFKDPVVTEFDEHGTLIPDYSLERKKEINIKIKGKLADVTT